jgi:hypothetical protein
MSTRQGEPVVSVVIPTFRRPQLLQRAVESVLAQSFTDWELIVSDDDAKPDIFSVAFLSSLAERDSRIRFVRNPGPRGQVGNFNHALSYTRGTWIKPLYDDDQLDPECLSTMVRAAGLVENAALVTCRAHRVYGGFARRDPGPSHTGVEIIQPRHTLLGMYLQEDVGGIAPSAVMVPGPLVRSGVKMRNTPKITSLVDCVWFMDLARYGPSVLVNRPLVALHQDDRPSITQGSKPTALDGEFLVLRALQYPLLDPSLNPPTPKAVQSMLRLIRAMHRAHYRDYRAAIGLALSSPSLAGWVLAARWAMRRRNPDKYSSVPRLRLSLPTSTSATGAEGSGGTPNGEGGVETAAPANENADSDSTPNPARRAG